MKKRLAFGLVVVLACLGTIVGAQKSARAASPPLPSLPVTLFTSELPVRVTAVATGLSHPWSLAFLPDPSTSLGASGMTMLVTERSGRLRIIRHGALDPKPVEGVPAVYNGRLAGLLDLALHPEFRENQLLYLSYSKVRADKRSTTVLARARWTGTALADLTEIFVANTWSVSDTNYGGRIAFDRDGFLFLTVGERQEQNRAGPRRSQRQSAPSQRRRQRAGRQSVRGAFRLHAGDLFARAQKPSGADNSSDDRGRLGDRARAAWR